MFQFHVTAKLAKALKAKPEEPPVPDGTDWLELWYVRDIPLDLPLDALLFTNAETLYSLVHPFDRRERIDEIVGVFQHRLEHITGRDFTSDPGAFRVCLSAAAGYGRLRAEDAGGGGWDVRGDVATLRRAIQR